MAVRSHSFRHKRPAERRERGERPGIVEKVEHKVGGFKEELQKKFGGMPENPVERFQRQKVEHEELAQPRPVKRLKEHYREKSEEPKERPRYQQRRFEPKPGWKQKFAAGAKTVGGALASGAKEFGKEAFRTGKEYMRNVEQRQRKEDKGSFGKFLGAHEKDSSEPGKQETYVDDRGYIHVVSPEGNDYNTGKKADYEIPETITDRRTGLKMKVREEDENEEEEEEKSSRHSGRGDRSSRFREPGGRISGRQSFGGQAMTPFARGEPAYSTGQFRSGFGGDEQIIGSGLSILGAGIGATPAQVPETPSYMSGAFKVGYGVPAPAPRAMPAMMPQPIPPVSVEQPGSRRGRRARKRELQAAEAAAEAELAALQAAQQQAAMMAAQQQQQPQGRPLSLFGMLMDREGV